MEQKAALPPADYPIATCQIKNFSAISIISFQIRTKEAQNNYTMIRLDSIAIK